MKQDILFMNFIMDPENAGLNWNFTFYESGIEGSEKYVDSFLLTAPENQPPASISPPSFISPCSRKTDQLYDKVWTQLMK